MLLDYNMFYNHYACMIVNFTDDFYLRDDEIIVFTPSSAVGGVSCVSFTPVDDAMFEGDETFIFEIYTEDVRDLFILANGSTSFVSTASIVIQDDESE